MTTNYYSSIKEVTSRLKPELVKETLKNKFNDPKVRINDEVASLVAEVASDLIIESALRAHVQAVNEGESIVLTKHVQRSLPKLLLDFI